MEIRDPVHGSIYYSDQEVAVLDTQEYQRLRTIKQLGFSEFSFPGATHNRYIHSIGVGHLVGQAFDSIFKVYPFSKPAAKTRLRQATRLAALLHDVGHGPLSHTTEQVMPEAIHDHAPSQRVVVANHIFSELTASALSRLIRSRIDRFEEPSRHFGSRMFVIAPLEQRLIATDRFLQPRHARRYDNLVFQPAILIDQRLRGTLLQQELNERRTITIENKQRRPRSMSANLAHHERHFGVMGAQQPVHRRRPPVPNLRSVPVQRL